MQEMPRMFRNKLCYSSWEDVLSPAMDGVGVCAKAGFALTGSISLEKWLIDLFL